MDRKVLSSRERFAVEIQVHSRRLSVAKRQQIASEVISLTRRVFSNNKQKTTLVNRARSI